MEGAPPYKHGRARRYAAARHLVERLRRSAAGPARSRSCRGQPDVARRGSQLSAGAAPRYALRAPALYPSVAGTVRRPRAAAVASAAHRPMLRSASQRAWEIDLWGRIRRSIEASEDSAQASAADLEQRALSLQTELAHDYLRVARDRRAARGADDTVAAYERSLALTQNRYAVGVAAARRRRAGADAAPESEARRPVDVQADARAARARDRRAAGRGAGAVHRPVGDRAAACRTIPPGVPSALLERRPDIAAAERRGRGGECAGRRGHAPRSIPTYARAGAASSASALANWLSLPQSASGRSAALAADAVRRGLRRGAARQAHSASTTRRVADLPPDGADGVPRRRGQPVDDSHLLPRRTAAPRRRRPVRDRPSSSRPTSTRPAGSGAYTTVVTVQATALNARQSASQLSCRSRRRRDDRADQGTGRRLACGWHAAKPRRTETARPGACASFGSALRAR